MKFLRRAVFSLLALALAGVIAFFIYFDAIVGAAVETGSKQALGVETQVGWVRIGLLSGNFKIGRFRIENPPGFETDHFFSFERVHFEIPPASLAQDTIVVPLVEIDGIAVALETVDGKANYEVILDNLKRFSSGGSAEPSQKKPAAEDAGGGKRLVVREIVIRNIAATIDLGKVSGGTDRVGVEIPEIHLRPNQSTGSAEASVAELTQVVVTAVLTGIAKKAPAALAQGLFKGLGGLKSVVIEMPGSLPGVAGSVVGEGAKNLGEGAKKLGESAGSAVKGLGGLFGGGDEDN